MRISKHYDAIKTMYQEGNSIVDISRKLNMQRATVHTILRNNGFLNNYKTLTVAEIDDFLIKGTHAANHSTGRSGDGIVIILYPVRLTDNQ